MKNKTVNYFFTVLIIIIGVVYLFKTRELAPPKAAFAIGAAYFPIMLSVSLLALCLFSLIQTFRNKDDSNFTFPNFKLILLALVFIMIYFVIWKVVGYFYLITLLLTLALFTIFRPKQDWKKYLINNMAIAVAFTAIVYILFDVVLELNI